MKTLEPGHRLNPDGIGAISAGTTEPILITSLLAETPLGHRYRAKQGDRPLIVSTYERRHLADAVLAGRLEQGLGAATSAAHQRLMSTHGFDLSSVVPFAVADDPRCTTVAQFLERRLAKAKMPSIRTGMRLLKQLCEALDYLHPQIVHGLITPSCTFVDSKGNLTLGGLGEGYASLRSDDFARMVTEGKLPMPGRELGPNGRPTVATDVYMVAAFFVEVLTGRPYANERQLDALLTTFHSRGTQIIRQALHPDPDQRFPTIAAFRDEIVDAYKNGPQDGNRSRLSRVSHASHLTSVSQLGAMPAHEGSFVHGRPQPVGAPGQPMQMAPSGAISLTAAEQMGAQHDPYAGTTIGPSVDVENTPVPGSVPGGPPPPPAPAELHRGPSPHSQVVPMHPPQGQQQQYAHAQGQQQQYAHAQGQQQYAQQQYAQQQYAQQQYAQQQYAQQQYAQQQYAQPQYGQHNYPQGGNAAVAQNRANAAVPQALDYDQSSSLSLGLGSGSLGDLRLGDVDGGGEELHGGLGEVDLSSPVTDADFEPTLGHTGDGPAEDEDMDAGELAAHLEGEDEVLRCYLSVRDGIEYGPFSFNQLRRSALDGQLSSVDTLINRNLNREFMAADHPRLRPIFMRLARERETVDAQAAFEEEQKRLRRSHSLETLRWVALAVLVFGGAGLFLWFRANGG